jgi:hypothetical protein
MLIVIVVIVCVIALLEVSNAKAISDFESAGLV